MYLRYVCAAALGIVTLTATASAWSQAYPVKPIRMVVALAAGGPAGVDPETGTPEQLAAKLRIETEKWGKVVKAAGMKVQ